MSKTSYKVMYDALVANADRAAAKHEEEKKDLQNQLRWSREELAGLELKMDMIRHILGGKKEEE